MVIIIIYKLYIYIFLSHQYSGTGQDGFTRQHYMIKSGMHARPDYIDCLVTPDYDAGITDHCMTKPAGLTSVSHGRCSPAEDARDIPPGTGSASNHDVASGSVSHRIKQKNKTSVVAILMRPVFSMPVVSLSCEDTQ